jgi:hypothetical protein
LQLDRIETFVSQAQQYINQVAYLANASYIVNVPTSPGFGVTDYTNNALDLITGQKPTRPATFGDIEVIGPNAPVLDFRDIDQTLIDSVQAKLLTDLESSQTTRPGCGSANATAKRSKQWRKSMR